MRTFPLRTIVVALVVFSTGFAATTEAGETASEGPAAGQSLAISPLATRGPIPAPIEPPSAEQVDRAIARGVDFLLQTQFDHGAWGSIESKKLYRVYSPIPGAHLAYRTAVTSLAVVALIESRDRFDGDRKQAMDKAIDRGQAWLLENADDLRRAAPDGLTDRFGMTLYNIWGHAYAIPAIRQLHQRAEGNQSLQDQLISLMKYQVQRLETSATINGGWGYYDSMLMTKRPSDSSMSFTTATVLVALKDAEALGIEFSEKYRQEAVASIRRQRLPDFSYLYGEYLKLYPRAGINRPAGSLGRSQACNLAMRLYGDKQVTDEVIKTWLNRLYARNGWLSIGRKGQRPHESHFAIAGYFYYYGHYYAAMCIEQLPEAERPYFQDHLAHILLPLQEKDGSWWDFPLYDYHQQYGTAMAVSALVRCGHGKSQITKDKK